MGPFTDTLDICSQLDSSHILDCSYSSSTSEDITFNSQLAGSYYMFLFTNYSNQPCDIIFLPSDSSTVQDTLFAQVDTCTFLTQSVTSAYIAGVYTEYDTTYVVWSVYFGFNNLSITQPYVIDSIGTYLFLLEINNPCGPWTTTINYIYTVTQSDLDNLTWDYISETSLNSDVQIYPNPITDVLNIKSSKEISNILLIDNIGRELKYNKNTSDLPSGVYFVKVIFADNTTHIEKIIK